MTVNWGQRPQILCCKSHVFVKSKFKKPYVVEGTSNGSITTRGEITFGGGKVGNVYRRLEGVNRRPLGLANSQRVQNPLCLLTQPGYNANKTCVSPEQAAQMKEELRLLLEKGAIAPVTNSQGGFYSNLFLVPK